MDEFRKVLEAFGKIAPHLRKEQVLIGLVFVLFVSHSAIASDQILVFMLALIVVLGLFAVLFIKLRQRPPAASVRKNYEIEINWARRLLESAEEVESEPADVRNRLMEMARDILLRADRVDFASDAQGQIDETNKPPPDPDQRE